MDQFIEVTSGVDRLYSIPSTRLQHQGTYQCEIYSDKRSIVRLYYYLTVTPQAVVGHTELQATFDLSLLPQGRIFPLPTVPPHSIHPSSMLIAACLTSLLLMLFLSLWTLYWSLKPEQTDDAAQPEGKKISDTES
ncbi:hypothetical protein LDENG_00044830 [Lucifuga dentata]|nr:hypothetical protein LDENG_00044830 [Lucifuga dentata]